MKMCEVCGEYQGSTNSRFVGIDAGDGIWICFLCEAEAETDAIEEAIDRYGNYVLSDALHSLSAGNQQAEPPSYDAAAPVDGVPVMEVTVLP